MPNTDLHTAVSNWVTYELERQAPDKDLGYWVTLKGADTAMPRIDILIVGDEHWAMERASWPPDPGSVSRAVWKALEKIAQLSAGKSKV